LVSDKPLDVDMVAAAEAVSSGDVWKDQATLRYVKERELPEGTSQSEAARITRRARNYVMQAGKLCRRMPDDTLRLVPEPEQRPALIKATHEQTGHFGARRTAHMVATSYWWYGLTRHVRQMVAHCEVCDRVRASFNVHHPVLSPLPIGGLFYRWGVDLCGPFVKTKSTNYTYIMIAIEHFSKHIEMIPLKDKSASTTAAAFLSHVLGRFGACAEVVTDQGTEFMGAFHGLLQQALIDHRFTSANHPQADGLSERAVQTVKRALRKLCEEKGGKEAWDTMLPWIALGYRCSAQESTGFSPYQLLYGRLPVIPPAIYPRMAEPIDFDSPTRAASELTERAALLKRHCAVAMENLRIAQHRDTLRYAKTRSGAYAPRMRRYDVGDYVYLKGNAADTLDFQTRPEILRVLRVRPAGILVLQGKCGRTIERNVVNVAPCHLPHIDGAIDEATAKIHADVACEACNFPDDTATMLLCDKCSRGWHLRCLTPRLSKIPTGEWVCPTCKMQEGAVEAMAEAAADELAQPRRRSARAAGQAANLDGRWLVKEFEDEATGRTKPYWGRITNLGAKHKPYCLRVEYQDGDEETMTVTEAARYVMPAGATPPRDDELHAGVTMMREPALPMAWDLTQPDTLRQALNMLMPGRWVPAHVTRLCTALSTASLPLAPTATDEVTPLLSQVDFSAVRVVVEPWCGTGGVTARLQECGVMIHTNDRDPQREAQTHLDALQPGTWRQWQVEWGCIDAVVTSPWFTLLDLALPLAMAYAEMVVCCHVPGHFLTDAHPARAAWLARLHRQGRMHVVMGLPRGVMGRRCLWLLIFASRELKAAMLKPPSQIAGTFSF
jgi:transposase InsO family protein